MLKNYLAGWYRTIRFAAPKEMESIATVYRNNTIEVDSDQIERALDSFHRIFKTIYNLPSHLRSDLQLPRDGVGDLYHRQYSISMNTQWSASDLMRSIQSDINGFCDPQLAQIDKEDNTKQPMAVGDDFHIAITGPWDGPVRTVHVDDTSFVLATRFDHLEAGLILFSVHSQSPGKLTFCIQSWASSASPLVWFTYSVIGISRKMQTKMWRYFCLKVVKESGGDAATPLEVQTRKIKIAVTKET